jgi:hypothetical protein
VAEEVEGVRDALFKKVKTREEGHRFIRDYLMGIIPPVSSLGTTSLQTAVAAAKEVITPQCLNEMGGRVIGVDTSREDEGKLLGISLMDENKLRDSLVPCARSMSVRVKVHLCNQGLDVLSLPHSVSHGMNKSAEQSAALTRA